MSFRCRQVEALELYYLEYPLEVFELYYTDGPREYETVLNFDSVCQRRSEAA